MAKDRYVPISMLVDIAEHCAQPHFFALTGPKDWIPDLSRKIFHESVHFWQYVSQGFLIQVVEDDWRRLRQFAQTGEIVPAGSLKVAWLAEDAIAGFSPRDLMEAHARYCDIHYIGQG